MLLKRKFLYAYFIQWLFLKNVFTVFFLKKDFCFKVWQGASIIKKRGWLLKIRRKNKYNRKYIWVRNKYGKYFFRRKRKKWRFWKKAEKWPEHWTWDNNKKQIFGFLAEKAAEEYFKVENIFIKRILVFRLKRFYEKKSPFSVKKHIFYKYYFEKIKKSKKYFYLFKKKFKIVFKAKLLSHFFLKRWLKKNSNALVFSRPANALTFFRAVFLKKKYSKHDRRFDHLKKNYFLKKKFSQNFLLLIKFTKLAYIRQFLFTILCTRKSFYRLFYTKFLTLIYKKIGISRMNNKGGIARSHPQGTFDNTSTKVVAIEKNRKNNLTQSKFIYANFIKQYIAGYVEFFFKKKTFVRIHRFRAMTIALATSLFSLFLKLRYLQRRVKKHFNLREFINVLWVSLFYKNVEVLKDWFIFTLNGVPFYKHKNVLSTFRVLLIYGRKFLFQRNNIVGFKFDVRGKVSVGGNKRKRHYLLKYGYTSLAAKDLRVEYTQGCAWTKSGALGITYLLAF